MDEKDILREQMYKMCRNQVSCIDCALLHAKCNFKDASAEQLRTWLRLMKEDEQNG